MTASSRQPTVAIVGGGLAGLAAACALSDSGFAVTLFERRPFLGGRASSYEHPGTGEVVDNCQHVLFGSCTNLIAFYRRIGILDKIRWFDRMTFIEPGGRQSVLQSTFLPAPLHVMPSFLVFKFLSAWDKLVLSRALAALVMSEPKDDGTSFHDWLLRHRQTSAAIERFWKPILVSALSEDLDRIAVPYAAQVVRESMKSPAARSMGIPTVPLTHLYDAAKDYVTSRGGVVRFRSGVQAFVPTQHGQRLLLQDSQEEFDYGIFAVPFDLLAKLLPNLPESRELQEKIASFKTSPITGVHLWFDRQITDLPHAVLLDRTIQWMFHKSVLLGSTSSAERAKGETGTADNGKAETEKVETWGAETGKGTTSIVPVAPTVSRARATASSGTASYVELVISSSKSLLERPRQEIIDLALDELREFFPAARNANLVKSTVIKEVNATFSPAPGIDQYRPKSQTPWPHVFLAGDWTDTGWPATMEGAVRSGYLAAEALTKQAGSAKTFLFSDLPASGLMRILGR